jgi:hypothetical protein
MKDNLTKTFEELYNQYSAITAKMKDWNPNWKKDEVQDEIIEKQDQLNQMLKMYDDRYDKFENEVIKAGKDYWQESEKGNNPIKPSVILMKDNQLELTGKSKYINRRNPKIT